MSGVVEMRAVLVANRGEIALRIMRTARAEGIECIAVYTDVDAGAPHVRFADQAINIGVGPVADSYLDPARIIAAAKDSGADAVHPGYGFLSENAAFAAACVAANLTFVGPSAEAIALMGNKAAAKRRMLDAGVPCVPGYEGEDQSAETLLARARDIGFPLMIKAAAGGGGRGMRLVERADGFVDALTSARSEASGAFGSDEVILEKAIQRPRHVEIQVFADRHGNVVHLGERDCSVQRRHQKVVEEAPCPVMTPDLRAAMGAAAVEAARAIGYEGAGTVEFLLDADGKFLFLEMNTRLQVEHPVTELVTGLDLVALQFAVARGAPLGLVQDEVKLSGHAIEVRLYVEDPSAGFIPSAGRIERWRSGTGPGIRVDDGIVEGQDVSPFYDPMLAKVIAYGASRDEALARLIRALGDTLLFGPANNRDFLIDLLGRPGFARGEATTGFIADEYGDGPVAPDPDFAQVATIAALIHARQGDAARDNAVAVSSELVGWGSPGMLASRMTLALGGTRHDLHLTTGRDRVLTIADADSSAQVTFDPLAVDGWRVDLRGFAMIGDRAFAATGRRQIRAELVGAAATVGEVASGMVVAPMHGQVLELGVAEGDRVNPGDLLAILEAMKMQHELRAGVVGRVRRVAGPGQVRAGDVVVEIDEGTP